MNSINKIFGSVNMILRSKVSENLLNNKNDKDVAEKKYDYSQLLEYQQLIDGEGVAKPICDAIICDKNTCDMICDQICGSVCDQICGSICDKICDKICDVICDSVCLKNVSFA